MTAHDYPADADGAALRRISDGGSDMTRPMEVDFHVAAADLTTAELISDAVSQHGFSTKITADNDGTTWTIWCTRQMVATYSAIIEAQSLLDLISGPFGGYSDGWGSFGNAKNDV